MVIGESQAEVIIFRDTQTDRHFIIIYISSSPPSSLSTSSTLLLTEFLEQNILEPFMGDNLHSRIEDSQHVVCVFVARVPVQRTLLISLVLVGMADKMGFGSFME